MRTERTAAGDQRVIADAPRPSLPDKKLSTKRTQVRVRDLPLFGQDEAARERSQTDLFGQEPTA